MDDLNEYERIVWRIEERVAHETKLREENNAFARQVLENQDRLFDAIEVLSRRMDIFVSWAAKVHEGIQWLGRLLGAEWMDAKHTLEDIDAEGRRRILEAVELERERQSSSVVEVRSARDADVDVTVRAEGDISGGSKHGKTD